MTDCDRELCPELFKKTESSGLGEGAVVAISFASTVVFLVAVAALFLHLHSRSKKHATTSANAQLNDGGDIPLIDTGLKSD